MPILKDYYDPNLPVLLLSLHPDSTQAIIAGTKCIEFRRRFFNQSFQAVVYTTGPSGGVKLWLKCAQPIQPTVQNLIKIDHRLQSGEASQLATYFKPQSHGLAIPITNWVQIPQLSLNTLRTRFNDFVTPRRYVYLHRPNRQKQLAYFLQQPVCQAKRVEWQTKTAMIVDLF